MQLTGRTVRFWLSEDGRAQLAGVGLAQNVVDAYVVDENHLGVWIWLPQEAELANEETVPEVILMRWSHFWTASVEYIPQAPPPRPTAGFRPQ
jgi:hypothetical protein